MEKLRCENIASIYIWCLLGKSKINCNEVFKKYQECASLFGDS